MKNENWAIAVNEARLKLQKKNFLYKNISVHLRIIWRVWVNLIEKQLSISKSLISEFEKLETAYEQILFIKQKLPKFNFWQFCQEVFEPFLKDIENEKQD